MEFAYFDESGDCGGKGSKYLVLTLMVTKKVELIKSIINKAKSELYLKKTGAKWLKKHGGEIKFHQFPDKYILEKTIKALSKIKANVYYLIFDKCGFDIEMSQKGFFLGHLFYHINENSGGVVPSKIHADSNFFNKEKTNYFILRKYTKENVSLHNDSGAPKNTIKFEMDFSKVTKEDIKNLEKGQMAVKIEHINSTSSESLQALDLISGSIFWSYERGINKYMEILKTGNILGLGSVIKIQ